MRLSPGTKLGPYEILSPIGAGGMGEVYQAKDTRLDRIVAIKVLPDELAESAERKARFEREARAISQLNHPHICTLYDVGEENGVDFIVMEYLEGETLAELLKRGPLPLEKALEYGIQIADGLDAAHRARVVHRDLKPPNIIITRSGVKLLDFGLAKFLDRGLEDGASDAPTRQKDLTKDEAILGTLQYMAPEQLESKPVDHRTDIFAFGAVLYEMVSGEKAFQGESQASLIAAIMSGVPRPLTDAAALVPASLDHLVAKSLSKDQDRRWQTARDLTTELQWIVEARREQADEQVATVRSESSRPWKLATGAACILALALGWLSLREPALGRQGAVRFTVPVPSVTGAEFALSPDGRALAYTGSGKLWIRQLDAVEAESVPGTTSAQHPFWSPDSRNLAFFDQGKLKRLDSHDGSVVAVCDVSRALGGSWSAEGTIVFAGGAGALLRVPAHGGEPVAATRLDASLREGRHLSPWFLPDGRHFLYLGEQSTQAISGVFVGSLGSIETKRFITDADSNAIYASPGYLLFVRERNWFAQAFDVDRLELTGKPLFLAQDVDVAGNRLVAAASANGILAYRIEQLDKHVAWFDRSGRELGVVSGLGNYLRVQLSRDDTQAVVNMQSGLGVIEVFDLVRGSGTRFPDERTLQGHPILSPDGRRVLYAANPDGPEDLYSRATNGIGEAELIYGSTVAHKHPNDWSRDGRFVLFDTIHDLWVLPMEGGGEGFAFRTGSAEIAGGQFSPDGQWVVYNSDESGRREIYLQDFPEGNGRWRISTEGGTQARWRADGNELYYLDLASKLMAVDVDFAEEGEPAFGLPIELFQTRMLQNSRHEYDVTADGERFLMSVLAGKPAPIVVVLNWIDDVEQAVRSH